jgi:glycosyltransferase involved in cell wall biosynthesis
MNALELFVWGVIAYFVAVNTLRAARLARAAWTARVDAFKTWRPERLLASEAAPAISVLARVSDEAATVRERVRTLLALRYPRLEVVVIDDGSTDGTLGVLKEAYGLEPVHPVFRRRLAHREVRGLYRSTTAPRLVVVDKEQGGRHDALDAGLDIAGGELVCVIDAGAVIEPDALLRLVRPCLEGDESGANGLFRREALIAAGGIGSLNGSRRDSLGPAVATTGAIALAAGLATDTLDVSLLWLFLLAALGYRLVLAAAAYLSSPRVKETSSWWSEAPLTVSSFTSPMPFA